MTQSEPASLIEWHQQPSNLTGSPQLDPSIQLPLQQITDLPMPSSLTSSSESPTYEPKVKTGQSSKLIGTAYNRDPIKPYKKISSKQSTGKPLAAPICKDGYSLRPPSKHNKESIKKQNHK